MADPSPTSAGPRRRACLIVPGSSAAKLAKAGTRGADEIVIDLEDAVARTAKEQARQTVVDALGELDFGGATVSVRVNAPGTPWCHADVLALAAASGPLHAIVLPKVEDPGDLAFLERLLEGVEAAAGRPVPLRVQALIETATGMARIEQIAASGTRLESLILGYADLAASLGRSQAGASDLHAWDALRDRLLIAARAHGLQAIDGPYLGIHADQQFLAGASWARQLGFDGKWAIHPAQVAPLIELFQPSPEEIAKARQILEALESAERQLGAGAVAFEDQMLDEAVRLAASRTLARDGCSPVTDEPDLVAAGSTIDVSGPFFEDLSVGLRVEEAPALTLTSAHAALHQAILGSRLRLALDAELSREVAGGGSAILHPGLVCDVAIGQSTVLTRRVIANLFYRGLLFLRAPLAGDTLRTSTEVVALRQTSAKPGRPATGLAALRIRTVDQQDRRVLDFWRCAMLPLRDPEGQTGHADDLTAIAPELDQASLGAAVRGWRLDRFRALIGTDARPDYPPGTVWRVRDGDVVSCAPELARMSLNVAAAHHDATSTAAGRRLVYGGHTIGLAAAQATRALPDLVTFVAWHGCDHVAPVYEGDTLTSTLELERAEPLGEAPPARLLHLRSRVRAHRDGADAGEVLDWRFVAVAA